MGDCAPNTDQHVPTERKDPSRGGRRTPALSQEVRTRVVVVVVVVRVRRRVVVVVVVVRVRRRVVVVVVVVRVRRRVVVVVVVVRVRTVSYTHLTLPTTILV